MTTVKSPSLWVSFLLAYILFRACFMVLPWRDNRAISFDPSGYYLPLPAHFIYNDLATFSFYDTLAPKYNIGDANNHTVALPNGNRVLKYSLGMSLLYSPGFLLGHQVAKSDPAFQTDGYSTPYYKWLSIWSLLWACLGLFVLRKVLLQYFNEWAVAGALALLVLATNYLIYAGINNLMSHSFLFTLYAFLLYLSWRWHQGPSWWTAIGIGTLVGLMTITRPTEIIAILIPLLWGITHRTDWRKQWEKFKQNIGQLIVAALIIGAIGFIQLIYWKSITGDWLFYSYQEQGFDFLRPRLWKGLFSFRKGWLIYTPIMLFAIIGFWPLRRHRRSLFLPLLLFSVINFYIVYSWEIWTYGGSVGSRAMVQSYAIWCFPLAAFIQFILFRATTVWKIAIVALFLLFTDLNVMMAWNAHASSGQWHADYMSRAYYFKVAGRTNASKAARKFLDIDTELPKRTPQKKEVLVSEYFEGVADSAIVGRTQEHVFAGKYALRIDGTTPPFYRHIKLPPVESYRGVWLQASVRSMYIHMEWHEWHLAELQLLFFREGEEIKKKSIRLQWLSDAWQWHHAYFDIPLDDIYKGTDPSDEVRIVLQNGGGEKVIYLDDLTLEWFEY